MPRSSRGERRMSEIRSSPPKCRTTNCGRALCAIPTAIWSASWRRSVEPAEPFHCGETGDDAAISYCGPDAPLRWPASLRQGMPVMRLRLHASLFFAVLLTVAALAQSQDFTYTNINGAITITGYNGPGGNVAVPDTLAGLPVTRIGTNAFFNKTSLIQITIGDSVIVVGDSAFASCPNLANVVIGGSVAVLAYHAFDSCVSLTNITIPDSVTNIEGANAGCFGSCVDGGVFGGCTSLTNVVVG